jgi:hypothetical protein
MPLPFVPRSLAFLKKFPANFSLATVYDSKEVRTALLFYDDESGMLPKILGFSTEKLPTGAVSSSRIIQKEPFINALNFSVQKTLSVTAHKNVSTVFMGLSGESVLHTLTTAKITRSSTEKITQKELNGHFDRLFESASNNALENYIATTGNSQEDLTNILSSTAYIKINDSICANPIDREAGLLEISWYCAFAAQTLLESIETSTKKTAVKVKSQGPVLFALAESLKPGLGEYFDGVLLYINQDHTDIGVVFGGSLVEAKTLPMGEEAVTNNLALYTAGVGITLTEFTGIKTFASNFFVLRQHQNEELVNALNAFDWGKTIPLKTEAAFSYVTAENLKGVTIPPDCPLDLAVLNVLKYI